MILHYFAINLTLVKLFSQDDDDFEPDETAIECYTTPLDDKDCPVDEYIQFKNTLTGKTACFNSISTAV